MTDDEFPKDGPIIDGEATEVPPGEEKSPPKKPKEWRNKTQRDIKYTEEEQKTREKFGEVAVTGSFAGKEGIYVGPATEEQKSMVRAMVFAGIPQLHIAKCVLPPDALGRPDVQKLKYWFKHELENGRYLMVGEIAHSLAVQSRAGVTAASIYLLKVRGGPAFSEGRSFRNEPDYDPEAPKSLTKTEKQIMMDKIMEAVDIAVKKKDDESDKAKQAPKAEQKRSDQTD